MNEPDRVTGSRYRSMLSDDCPAFSDTSLAQIRNGVLRVPEPEAGGRPNPRFAAYVRELVAEDNEARAAARAQEAESNTSDS